MKKIHFANIKKWTEIKAVLFNGDESEKETVSVTESDWRVNFFFDFDDKIYNHLYFLSSDGERTGKIYPGSLSLGVEYKKNCKLDRNLTYLYLEKGEKNGRVENFVLQDVKNLSYREDKSKKISVFVPASYDEKTPHDLLYFFDAQNLFSEAGQYTENGDPYGSWQLDIVLDELHRQYGTNIIVVGIDNADGYRSRELFIDPDCLGEITDFAKTPDGEFAHGYLDRLSRFIVDTLHPFIKEKYCINGENVGIGGASMGGLASFYCGLREMGFYRYVLSYSPAFALYEISAFEKYFVGMRFSENKEVLPKIHIYCGGGDELEETLLPSSSAMKKLLVQHGYREENIFETYDIEKSHNEESWRLVLPLSFTYLLDL